MKKILSIAVLCFVALSINAVPAKRGWQTLTQADGTTIEVQLMGDEFCHYLINKEGQEVRENAEGVYEVVGQAPTAVEFNSRRAQSKVRRVRADVGTTPNLAPKGVVILVNFSDTKMKTSHTLAMFEDLCNSTNCISNNGYPSAAQYFRDQSNGAYQPVFDVFGPVQLSKGYAYYGKNVGGEDQYATDAVIEACILANQQYDIDFKDYDSDNDGYVDFVYVIYAGKGEASGGAANTIWPHNYSIQTVVYYAGNGTYSVYKKNDTKLDEVYLDNYAMSNELEGTSLTGIGTLCHEFGHVIGLPDFYDTNANSEATVNSSNYLTPNEWDIMDMGSYNGDGHCPPNYSAWEKYFFGWVTPENLGSNGAQLTLYPNGTTQHNVYQINTSGKLQTATTNGLNYYIENRQKQGWDKFVPASGMVIWKVNFNASKWTNNTPNNTDNNPYYTIVCSKGTQIGSTNSSGNVWPNGTTNSWSGVSGKPLKDITRSGTNITLTYIEVPVDPKYTVTWIVNGTQIEQQEYAIDGSENLVLPSATVTPCDGTEFIGWTAESEWFDPFENPADLFTTASGKVTGDATYRAVFK